jgi:Trypsin-co-occurring domain 1
VAESVPVRAGDVEFFVEVPEVQGVQTVGLDDAFSFEGVRDTIRVIGEQLTSAWETVKPDEASVEFGLKLTAKAGKLTGLIVEGGGEASLTIKLTWTKANTG